MLYFDFELFSQVLAQKLPSLTRQETKVLHHVVQEGIQHSHTPLLNDGVDQSKLSVFVTCHKQRRKCRVFQISVSSTNWNKMSNPWYKHFWRSTARLFNQRDQLETWSRVPLCLAITKFPIISHKVIWTKKKAAMHTITPWLCTKCFGMAKGNPWCG